MPSHHFEDLAFRRIELMRGLHRNDAAGLVGDGLLARDPEPSKKHSGMKPYSANTPAFSVSTSDITQKAHLAIA